MSFFDFSFQVQCNAIDLSDFSAVQGNIFDLSDSSVQFNLHFCIFSNALRFSFSCQFICFQPSTFFLIVCMFTLFTPFRLLNSVQIPSPDLSHLTFLYVLIYVALLKNIFNLTLYYSTDRIFCSKCIF